MSLAFSTAGESHGEGGLAFLDGLPKGLQLDEEFVRGQLRRRQAGYGRGGRQRLERDEAQFLCGVRRGQTLEAPLAIWIPNRDSRIDTTPDLTRPRPGHADLSGCLRHGDRDIRANLERASARETAARVAAGAVAQLLLREIGVEVLGHVVRIGPVASAGEPGVLVAADADLAALRGQVEASDCGVLEAALEPEMRAAIDAARSDRDSLGGCVEVVALGIPAGLGSFAQWDRRLDGRLAQALMSIQAIKAVEIGLGVDVGERRGSAVHDPIEPASGGGYRRPRNRAGGLEGGVTNGAPLVVRATKKPIATLRRPLRSVDLATGEAADAAFERSDVCAVPAAAVIAEAMVALVLADAALELFGGASIEAFCAGHVAHAARSARVVGGASCEGGT